MRGPCPNCGCPCGQTPCPTVRKRAERLLLSLVAAPRADWSVKCSVVMIWRAEAEGSNGLDGRARSGSRPLADAGSSTAMSEAPKSLIRDRRLTRRYQASCRLDPHEPALLLRRLSNQRDAHR